MKKILVVGSANMDLVVAADRPALLGETLLGGAFATYLGGKGANQAVAAARCGGQVAMLGAVGADPFGDELRAGLAGAGVDVSGLASVEEASGVGLIITTPDGGNSIIVAPGANGRLDAAAIAQSAFEDVGFVLAQLETPLDGVIRAAQLARSNDAIFILDPAPARVLPTELLELVDWLTPNETEARSILGMHGDFDAASAAAALQALGARGVIVKLGGAGAMVVEAGGEPRHIPPFPVEAVDSTAAGDAFNGAFAVALAEGAAPTDAALFASAAAALSVTRRGAQPSLPTRGEVDRLLNGGLLHDPR
ncbi:MAG TPA: ribokinase [Caulobacteraceae bacterium]|jgi:ribokinase